MKTRRLLSTLLVTGALALGFAASAQAFTVSRFKVAATGSTLFYKASVCGLQGIRTRIVARIQHRGGGQVYHHTWFVTPRYPCTTLTLRVGDPFPRGEYATALSWFAAGEHASSGVADFFNP